MNKIKRGVSLLLCSLLFGSAVTLGNVADVQAGKQIKTETKQTINNTKTKKKVSDDQTSGKTGRNEENKAGEGAQTDIAESKVTFFVLPVYTQGTTAISIDRDIGIGQIMDVGFTDRNFAVAVYVLCLKQDDGNTGAKRERSFRVFYGDDKSRRICKESNIYSICTDGYVYSIV